METQVTLSVAVMAHPRRADQAKALAEVTAAKLVWDTRNDEWDTGSRALLAHDSAATHHLVLQDDAVPVFDLRAHVTRAIAQHPDRIISLYLGTSRPPDIQPRVTAATVAAEERGRSWIQHSALLHGVAVVVPTSVVQDLVGWCRRFSIPYDERIGLYSRMILERPVLYTWPSLVDHDDGPTLVKHTDGQARSEPRVAHHVGVPSWSSPEVVVL